MLVMLVVSVSFDTYRHHGASPEGSPEHSTAASTERWVPTWRSGTLFSCTYYCKTSQHLTQYINAIVYGVRSTEYVLSTPASYLRIADTF